MPRFNKETLSKLHNYDVTSIKVVYAMKDNGSDSRHTSFIDELSKELFFDISVLDREREHNTTTLNLITTAIRNISTKINTDIEDRQEIIERVELKRLKAKYE